MAISRICSVEGCGKPIHCKDMCARHYQRIRNGTDMQRFYTPIGAPMAFIMAALPSTEIVECILWPYAKKSKGYGRVSFKGSAIATNRVVCQLVHGPAPFPKAEAAHECGNAGCINPNHLTWKTPKENAADKVRHGTRLYGERMGSAKLTNNQVAVIKREIRDSVSDVMLARRFGVTRWAIRSIRIGKAWKEVA
jgi:hypothetical protein